MKIKFVIILISGLWIFYLLALNCSPSPEPIDFGSDNCAYCKMTIVQRPFGAELVTNKGKVYKFDSIECMAAFYLKENVVRREDVHLILVTDFESNEKIVDALPAFYLHSPKLHSPMGMNLSAFENEDACQTARQKYGGEIIEWPEVIAMINEEWIQRGK